MSASFTKEEIYTVFSDLTDNTQEFLEMIDGTPLSIDDIKFDLNLEKIYNTLKNPSIYITFNCPEGLLAMKNYMSSFLDGRIQLINGFDINELYNNSRRWCDYCKMERANYYCSDCSKESGNRYGHDMCIMCATEKTAEDAIANGSTAEKWAKRSIMTLPCITKHKLCFIQYAIGGHFYDSHFCDVCKKQIMYEQTLCNPVINYDVCETCIPKFLKEETDIINDIEKIDLKKVIANCNINGQQFKIKNPLDPKYWILHTNTKIDANKLNFNYKEWVPILDSEDGHSILYNVSNRENAGKFAVITADSHGRQGIHIVDECINDIIVFLNRITEKTEIYHPIRKFAESKGFKVYLG